MKYIVAMLMLAVSPACAGASTQPIRGPDGQLMYRVTCHPDLAECYQEAGNRCEGGYHVLSQSMHWGGTVADLMPGPVAWYNVLVTCK